MSKQEYRAAQRAKPCGADGIAAIRKIAAEGYGKVNDVCVDTYSASAVVAVFDALNEANRAKLAALPVYKVVTVCFKLINQQQGAAA